MLGNLLEKLLSLCKKFYREKKYLIIIILIITIILIHFKSKFLKLLKDL